MQISLSVKNIKKMLQGIVLNTNLPQHFNDEYVLSQDEIMDYFPLFKDNDDISSVNQGLLFVNNNLFVIYPKLVSIRLTTDSTLISPCGNDCPLKTFGNFELIQRDINLNENVIRKDAVNVHAIIKSESEGFQVNKDYSACIISPNLDNQNRIGILEAAYAFKGALKKHTLQLTQTSNQISDWILDKTITDNIAISLNPSIISNEGGKTTINVTREFTKILIKKDLCDNILEIKEEKNNFENISKLCKYESTNNTNFKRLSNVIIVEPQKINSERRFCEILASYDGFEASITLEQEKGGILSYSYDLFFSDDKKELTYILPTSQKNEINIPLNSIQNQLIDEKLINSLPNYDLGFKKNDDWYQVYVDELKEDVSLTILVKNANNDKLNDRESQIIIYPTNDYHNQIILHLIQPCNKVINTIYNVLIDGNNEFTINTIDTAKITFKTLQKISYEDGSIKETYSLPRNMHLECIGHSTDDEVLTLGKLKQINFDGTHIMKPKFGHYNVGYDVFLHLNARVIDCEQNIHYPSSDFTIKLLSSEIRTYDYNFTFENKAQYIELFWLAEETNQKEIQIVSNKETYINGLLSKRTNITDLQIKVNDSHQNLFKLKQRDSNLFIEPSYINQNIESNVEYFEILQKESGKILKIKCVQQGQEKDKTINLKIELLKKDLFSDYFTSQNASLTICDINTNTITSRIPLQEAWLCQNIDSHSDILFEGDILLKINHNYKFIINNLNLIEINNINSQIQNINFNKIILIDNNINNILLKIEI